MKKIIFFLVLPTVLWAGFTSGLIQLTSIKNPTRKNNPLNYQRESDSTGQLDGNGLMGYITSKAPQPSTGYGAGIGFYVAVYPILPEPIDHFQIGLASTWIVPKNADNKNIPLCPPGSYARENWAERRGPTFKDVFQTIEGGLGMWGSTQFRAGYKPPKFQIVGVPDCYNGNYLISPGWSNKTTAAADNEMGIAQLSNHMLIPPDGLTFQDNPKGELFGYSWMSLPLSGEKKSNPPTGNQHWTLFLSLANFKGPLAFIIPDSWSKISKNYKIIYGRGLDAQEGNSHGGAQEFNTVPYFEVKDAQGTTFSKVPNFIYPVDEDGRTVLMQDVRYYSNKAISDAVAVWRNGGETATGRFDTSGTACFMAPITVQPISFKQTDERKQLTGIEKVVETTVIDGYSFGLQWKDSHISPNGVFPQYYKDTGSGRVAVPESDVPLELRTKEFSPAVNKENYSSPVTGAWKRPASSSGPYYTKLADGSTITYYWFKFIDQPSLRQYSKVWSKAMKMELQNMIEKIHGKWGTQQEYMPAPRDGKPLVRIDEALLVSPPKGFEIGYVPIVTAQEIKK